MSNVPLLDYCFLLFDSHESPKHVAGLQIFELPKNAPSTFVSDLVDQARKSMPGPPFNLKLHAPFMCMPQWIEDDQLNLEDHVFYEAVPEPHTMEELLERVACLHAEQLDRSQPLWEMYFFEQLKLHRFAVYLKVHHAYTDGMSLSRRVMSSLSTNRRKKQAVNFWKTNSDAHAEREHGLLDKLLSMVIGAGKTAVVVTKLGQLGLKHGLRLLHAGSKALPIPFSAPRTAFNTPLTAERSVAIAELPLEQVKTVAKRAKASVNDVLLSVCDRALGKYLDSHGGHPDKPLVAQMPISLHRATSEQGNQITIALTELASDVTDPLDRLREIHDHAANVKQEFADMTPESAEVYTLLMQSIAQLGETLGLDNTLPPLGNVVISNLIGPKRRRYLKGAPLIGVYPISTIAPGLAINITIYSYAGTLFFGLVAGHHAIPDLSPLANEITVAMKELQKALPKTSKTTRKRKRKRRAKPSPQENTT